MAVHKHVAVQLCLQATDCLTAANDQDQESAIQRVRKLGGKRCCGVVVQEEQEVRLHPQRVPGGLQDSELALEMRAQLVTATPWAPEVPHPATPSFHPDRP